MSVPRAQSRILRSGAAARAVVGSRRAPRARPSPGLARCRPRRAAGPATLAQAMARIEPDGDEQHGKEAPTVVQVAELLASNRPVRTAEMSAEFPASWIHASASGCPAAAMRRAACRDALPLVQATHQLHGGRRTASYRRPASASDRAASTLQAPARTQRSIGNRRQHTEHRVRHGH